MWCLLNKNVYFCSMLQFENQKIKQIVRKVLPVVTLGAMLYSCASIGRPDGGPYDETPPRFIGSTPEAGALNNKRTKVSLMFDEFIKLEKATEKVVVSPPQIQQPEIKASGKRIQVNLLDSLKPNTTYTIDFSDAIVDNNEGNPLGNFAFTFSTGTEIDTMEVAGTMLDASNLEPIKGMLVGLHSNLNDSAFTKLPFDRVARTDSRGRFSIRGVAPGKYRIYGLMDADQNFAFNQKSEMIAFHDSLIIPRMEERIRMDTAWVDSLTYDTIVEKKYMHYLPDDVILRAFKELNYSQYLIKSERLVPQKFTFYFAGKADTLPVLKGLNFDEKDAFVIEKNQRNDTIHYWVKDSLLFKQDTLSMSLTYLYTDTLNQLVPRTDTLNLVSKQKYKKEEPDQDKKKKKKKKGEEDEPEPTKFLPVNVSAPSSMDVYGYISLNFEEPIASYDTAAIHLRQKVDTLWKDIPFEFEQDSVNLKKFNLYYDWEPAWEYEFSVDSTAFHGIYGLFTDKIKQGFKVRSLDEYAKITFIVTGAEPNAFVELLDAQDKVVRQRRVEEGGYVDFYFLNPGKYTARLINDLNGNGVWDTGDFEKGVQPEEVYYYNQIVDPKANWELKQNWNIHAVPLDKQKLDELKKQKPDEDKKKIGIEIIRTAVVDARRNLIIGLVALLTGIFALPASAQCEAKNDAFQSGEHVMYDLYFNWKFVWVKAGLASLTTNATTYHSQPAYRINLLALGSKRADFFFKMRDTLTCVIGEKLEPRYFRKGAEEGKRYTVDEAWFSYKDGLCLVNQKRTYRDGAFDESEASDSRCIYDMLSILAQARSYDPADYKVGDKIKFPMATGRKVEEQTLIYRGKENVKAENGVTYRCLIFSLVEYDKKGKEKEVITFFITDDLNHLPVRLDLFLNFGSAKAFLNNVTGNRHPLTSIVK